MDCQLCAWDFNCVKKEEFVVNSSGKFEVDQIGRQKMAKSNFFVCKLTENKLCWKVRGRKEALLTKPYLNSGGGSLESLAGCVYVLRTLISKLSGV